MRLCFSRVIAIVVCVIPVGCAPEMIGSDAGGIVDPLAVLVEDAPGAGDFDAAASTPFPTAQSVSTGMVLTGSVTERGDYLLFEVAGSAFGDEWTITSENSIGLASFLVVMLDANYELLQRRLISSRNPLEHIIRADTPTLFVGVTPAYGSGGGDFQFDLNYRSGALVPAPRRQVVWVNFGPGTDVKVHRRAGHSFPAFDAATLDPDYAGATESMKAAILEVMREDYAGYNVVITSSDDGPPPSGTYATIHIGGDDERLLGLADNVDQYNANLGQTAVVYAEAFSDFRVMNLTVEEMAQMIGNTASHELGHLLGLFHTTSPVDLMDTTGTAWDLVADQSFTLGPLEPTVFPFGFENSPQRLAETVGYKMGTEKKMDVTKALSAAKLQRKAELRAIIRHELHCRCGNCLNPDD
ncbi:MAG: hypothetical protein KAY37_09370 [Phycisphaerae bacterium]|nr:hypothetical protein [Phycisphaerae bacterium]